MVMSYPVVALSAGAAPWLAPAVEQGGGVVGPLDRADALVHTGALRELSALPDRVRWVQLAAAGVESYLAAGVVDNHRVWTSAAGAYADTVGEHAVGMLLAGVRGLVTAAHESAWRLDAVAPRVGTLGGSTVAVVGAGGIGRRVIELLAPFDVRVIAVNRGGIQVPGATRTVLAADIDAIWDEADHVVLAAPATPDTRHLVDADVLGRLKPTSWIVNVGRGPLLDTDALVAALRAGRIGGAAMDVTDPEPLPDNHPLWTAPGVLVTPHTANPPRHIEAALARRIRDNVGRFATGRELLGVVDLAAGY